MTEDINRPKDFRNRFTRSRSSRDRLVVRTLRCGRNNPGSNPGHGSIGNSRSGTFFFRFMNAFTLYVCSTLIQ